MCNATGGRPLNDRRSHNHEGNVENWLDKVGIDGCFGSHNRVEFVCGRVEKNMSVHFSFSAVTKSMPDAQLSM